MMQYLTELGLRNDAISGAGLINNATLSGARINE